jgi:hypothetical protein
MGVPILPKFGPEPSRIPVYVVSDGDVVCHHDSTPADCFPSLSSLNSPGTLTSAATVPIEINGFTQTSSAVMLLSESRGTDRALLAHELFHALEFAYSLPAATGSWLGEASAAWAEHLYVPGPNTARTDIFGAFQDQSGVPPGVSLNDTSSKAHEEGAMVWLDYLEQVKGRAAIFTLWPAMVGVPSVSAVDGRLDNIAPWASNFPAFAVEDLNLNLPGLGDLSRHFGDIDPALPVGTQSNESGTTPTVSEETLVPDTPVNTPIALGALQANYDHLIVGTDVRDVKLDFGSVQPGSNADVTVLANVGGSWSAQSPGADGTLEFCRDTAGQDVSELYVVVDNHAFVSGQAVTGNYTATGKASCSKWPRLVTGTIQSTIHLTSGASPNLIATVTLSVSFTLTANGGRSVCPDPFHVACLMETSYKFGNTLSGTLTADYPAGYLGFASPPCHVSFPVSDTIGPGSAVLYLVDDPTVNNGVSQLTASFDTGAFDPTCVSQGASGVGAFVFPFSPGMTTAHPTLDPRVHPPGDTGTASLQFTY